MKKILLLLLFLGFGANCFATNSIFVSGGICLPVNERDQKVFINPPCFNIGYSHLFSNNIISGADVSFLYQKEVLENLIYCNYLIDFTINIGYSVKLNSISIIPQLSIGYARYFFDDLDNNSPKELNLFGYGALIDFSYMFLENYTILVRPELIFYGKDFISPLKILIGIGINY